MSGTIAVKFSVLLISHLHSGHFFIVLLVLLRYWIKQVPQKICVQSNKIGFVILSRHIEQVLFLISVILFVKSFNLFSKILSSLSIFLILVAFN